MSGTGFAFLLSMRSLVLIFLILNLPRALAEIQAPPESLLSPEVSPKEAWDYLQTGKQEELPHHIVTFRSFFSQMGENLLFRDSKRTVESGNHFIPPQRKVIFPNGICLRGEWVIDDHSHDYTGYYKANSRGVIIARAAVSLGKIYYKELRTLALSGKIFPTTDPGDPRPLPAANFLLMNDNGGKRKTYLTEADLTNAAPRTIHVGALPLLRIALFVAKTFDRADLRRDIRQLYQIAELEAEAPYSSPKWMLLSGEKELQKVSRRVKAQDFREEVQKVIDENKSLTFEIRVANDHIKEQPVYEKIGKIVFTEYVASRACDMSLHFQHPPYRPEYTAPVINQYREKNPSLRDL